MERVGVFICECGPNIKDAIDIQELVGFASRLDNVVMTLPFRIFGSEEGKELIKQKIRENKLTRVVIAACSPKEHEHTFKQVLEEAGLNGHLLQIANIREQCAWVIRDKTLATEKAKVMLKGAVRRVIHHEPLEKKEIECVPDVLVVGAGVAGIGAALTLAQKNRKVYLIERLPSIGGKVARYEDLFPNLECASCVLEPELDEVFHKENIQILTCCEVEEVLGFFGNFTVKIREKARFVDVDACIGCGACFDACPVKVVNEFNEGLDERKAIYIPYPGALPNVAVIDRGGCVRFNGGECNACQLSCPFGAIHYDAVEKIHELKVGAVVLATGFDLFDPKRAPQYGYGKFDNIYTSLEFERITNSDGPTGGKIQLKDGRAPQSVAIIHCVGSRSERHNEYCSGICCMYSLKFAHLLKDKLPEVKISQFYSDLCLPAKDNQRFLSDLFKKGIELVRLKAAESIEITKKEEKLLVTYKGIFGKEEKAAFDMVILSPAVEPTQDATKIARLFDISQDEYGFFAEEHNKLAPVSTSTEGIFIAGCAQGPRDIQSSVAQGQAAAGRILSRLIPGERVELAVTTAKVDEELCGGCRLCMGLCPFKAITFDEEGRHLRINEVLCRGCGVCGATCPSGAIRSKHFTEKQIFEEIRGLL